MAMLKGCSRWTWQRHYWFRPSASATKAWETSGCPRRRTRAFPRSNFRPQREKPEAAQGHLVGAKAHLSFEPLLDVRDARLGAVVLVVRAALHEEFAAEVASPCCRVALSLAVCAHCAIRACYCPAAPLCDSFEDVSVATKRRGRAASGSKLKSATEVPHAGPPTVPWKVDRNAPVRDRHLQVAEPSAGVRFFGAAQLRSCLM